MIEAPIKKLGLAFLSALAGFWVSFSKPCWPDGAEVIDDLGHIMPVSGVDVSRIASISTFAAEVLASVKLKPVAVSEYPTAFPPYISNLSKVPSLGVRSRTNFSVLSEATPSLVIGVARMIELYKRQFHRVAPTVAFDLVTYQDSETAITKTLMLLGKEKTAEKIHTCYEALLSNISEKMPKTFTSIFLSNAPTTPRAYFPHHATPTILEKIGMPSVVDPTPYASKFPFSMPVGLEWLLLKNPDVIFMYEATKPKYVDSPAWKALNAVKNNRVYYVGMMWREPEGPLSRIWVAMDAAHKLQPELIPAPTAESVRKNLCV